MTKKNTILIVCAGVGLVVAGILVWRGQGDGPGSAGGEGLDPETARMIEDRAGGTVQAEPDDPNPPARGSGKRPR